GLFAARIIDMPLRLSFLGRSIRQPPTRTRSSEASFPLSRSGRSRRRTQHVSGSRCFQCSAQKPPPPSACPSIQKFTSACSSGSRTPSHSFFPEQHTYYRSRIHTIWRRRWRPSYPGIEEGAGTQPASGAPLAMGCVCHVVLRDGVVREPACGGRALRGSGGGC